MADAPIMSGVTIADIQKKISEKFDEKYKGGMTKTRLKKMFEDADKDHDGFITFPEFLTALETTCNALSNDEAAFLFQVLAHSLQPPPSLSFVADGVCPPLRSP